MMEDARDECGTPQEEVCGYTSLTQQWSDAQLLF
jgi:hypothetical protein